MPLTVARRLGFHNYTPSKISLILADRSVRYPVGLLENIPVQIGECWILTDFVVLELEEEPRDPIILGRPFLATAGAIVNVKKGKIDLHLKDLVMEFDVETMLQAPMEEKQTFWVDTIDEITAEMMQEIHSGDPLEFEFGQEEDFDEDIQWPVKAAKYEHPPNPVKTPKKVSFNIEEKPQKDPISDVRIGAKNWLQRSIDPGGIDEVKSTNEIADNLKPIPDIEKSKVDKDFSTSNIRNKIPRYTVPARRKGGTHHLPREDMQLTVSDKEEHLEKPPPQPDPDRRISLPPEIPRYI